MKFNSPKSIAAVILMAALLTPTAFAQTSTGTDSNGGSTGVGAGAATGAAVGAAGLSEGVIFAIAAAVVLGVSAIVGPGVNSSSGTTGTR